MCLKLIKGKKFTNGFWAEKIINIVYLKKQNSYKMYRAQDTL